MILSLVGKNFCIWRLVLKLKHYITTNVQAHTKNRAHMSETATLVKNNNRENVYNIHNLYVKTVISTNTQENIEILSFYKYINTLKLVSTWNLSFSSFTFLGVKMKLVSTYPPPPGSLKCGEGYAETATPITCVFYSKLKHTTTLFSLSDHDVLSREWRVIVHQVQS